jgi:ABC-2 type transport system ATP-binding protein
MQSIFAVETERLCKLYRGRAVINNLTLSIAPGEVVGVLGLNGAGKSTLLRMLVGAVRPTSGSLRVLSLPIGDARLRGRIGYLAEKCPLQEFLTAHEALALHGSLMGLEHTVLKQRIPELIRRVGAPAGRIAEMSRGMRQRVGIAQAFLCDPEVVMLDEPASALDTEGRQIL